jgi:FixJ family two-component response regulator
VSNSVLETQFIACVDDDESVGEALKEMLMALDLNAEAYSSAESFLQSGMLDRTACLITDVKMHGMSGFYLMRRLNALGYRIPTIVVTSYANDGIRKEAIDAGAVCFLSKPVAKQELLACIERVLNRGHEAMSPRGP